MIDDGTGDAELDELHAAGVPPGGVNFVAHQAGAPDLECFDRARALIDGAPTGCRGARTVRTPTCATSIYDGDLVDLVADIAPDPTVLDRILVDNPERLYFDL